MEHSFIDLSAEPRPQDETLETELDAIGRAMDSDRDNIRYARLLASIARSLARIEAQGRTGGF